MDSPVFLVNKAGELKVNEEWNVCLCSKNMFKTHGNFITKCRYYKQILLQLFHICDVKVKFYLALIGMSTKLKHICCCYGVIFCKVIVQKWKINFKCIHCISILRVYTKSLRKWKKTWPRSALFRARVGGGGRDFAPLPDCFDASKTTADNDTKLSVPDLSSVWRSSSKYQKVSRATSKKMAFYRCHVTPFVVRKWQWQKIYRKWQYTPFSGQFRR